MEYAFNYWIWEFLKGNFIFLKHNFWLQYGMQLS